MDIMPNPSNDEIRYKILEVLYKIASKGTDWRVKRSYLMSKLNFDEKLIDFNLLYLDSRKLAEVVGTSRTNWEVVRITGKGIDVYEHKLDFASQYPFIKIAIQNIDGPVYGGAVQAIDSKVDINERISKSFNNAYSIVNSDASLSDEKKTEIRGNLKELEEEVKAEKPDESKVRRLWDWIKNNAQWVVPTIKEIIEDILKALSG